jgi:PAS domain S-box-containing protein
MADYSPEPTSGNLTNEKLPPSQLVRDSTAKLGETQALYVNMFHSSAFSAWRLDATRLRQILGELKEAGVTDLVEYAAQNPSFIVTAIRSLIVQDVNEATLELFGAPNREALIGHSVERFWIPGEYQCIIRSISASFNNEPGFRSETRMLTLDRREIDVIFTRSASPELAAINQTIVCIVDITDRVRAQHALVELQSSIAHADRCCLMGELDATIAHEVTQPLSAIITHGQVGLRLLGNSAPNLDEVRMITRRIIADSQRAADIIARIRLMAAPHAIEYSALSLNNIISDTLALVASQLTKRSIRLNLEFSDDIPNVVGDSIQLQQVLLNLITNAMQAMEETEAPQLAIRTYNNDSGMVATAIEDNGHGIKPEHIDRIFEQFFTTKRSGMGIGLPMCRSLIQAHGGTLTVANRPAGGACVTLLLPIPESDHSE